MGKKSLFILLGVLVLVAFYGCGSSSEFIVAEDQKPDFKASTADIIDKTSTENISAETIMLFEKLLRDKLFNFGPFREGNDLKIEYMFFQDERGSRLLSCCWLGGLMSEVEGMGGTVWVQVKISDSKGVTVRMIEVKNSVSYNVSNLWGISGAYEKLLNETADQIATYIKFHFN